MVVNNIGITYLEMIELTEYGEPIMFTEVRETIANDMFLLVVEEGGHC